MKAAEIILVMAVFGAMAVLGVFLCMGRGVFLIAGYKRLSEEKRKKYDIKKLTRFTGLLLLGIDAAALAGLL